MNQNKNNSYNFISFSSSLDSSIKYMSLAFFIASCGILYLGITDMRNHFEQQKTLQQEERQLFNQRIKFLDEQLQDWKISEDIKVPIIAKITKDFSIEQIEKLIAIALLCAIDANADYLEMKHINIAWDFISHGFPMERYQSSEEIYCTAIHEAGHAIALIYQNQSYVAYQVTILGHETTLGHVRPISHSIYNQYVKGDYENYIIFLLCGGVAEQLFNLPSSRIFDENKGFFDLCSRDGIEQDIQLAREYADKIMELGGWGKNRKYENSDDILERCYQQAVRLIISHKDDVEKIAHCLEDKETIYIDELYDLLGLQTPKFEI